MAVLDVELEGFESSSNKGTNLLSTCLSLLRFSGVSKTKATNSNLSFFNFGQKPKHILAYFRFTYTTWPARFGTTASGWCLVSTPVQSLSYIHYTSIKQQERNFLRQLNLLTSKIKVPADYALHAYKSLHLAVKTGQPRSVITNTKIAIFKFTFYFFIKKLKTTYTSLLMHLPQKVTKVTLFRIFYLLPGCNLSSFQNALIYR